METDYQKLLNACKDYRAKLDELEKENAKLKDELKEEKIHRSLDGWNEAAMINELKRENAALREDKARMDHLACGFDFPKLHDGKWHCFAGEFFTLREAIDAERKEAQP